MLIAAVTVALKAAVKIATLLVPLLLDVAEDEDFSATIPRGCDFSFYQGCVGVIELRGSKLGKGFSNPVDREEVFETASAAAKMLNEKGMEERRLWRMHTLTQACTSMFWRLNYGEVPISP